MTPSAAGFRGFFKLKFFRSPPLFWRTFLLIVLLIVAILAAWLQSFRAFDREPRARQVAAQMVSIVNITRSALLYSDPVQRRALLDDLAVNEGVRVAPLEAGDKVEPFPRNDLTALIADHVMDELGRQTRLANGVNGIYGLWVSFEIEDDAYWVLIDRNPLAIRGGRQWVGWALMATLMSLLVAIAITRVVNRPLAALSKASRQLGSGELPEVLPETGPAEIRAVNRSFNRMVADLSKLESDRAVLLAGISHDLRTPMTRLRLELEINDLPESARAAMVGDLEQMDEIVGQFLAYGRTSSSDSMAPCDLGLLMHDCLRASRLESDPTVTLRVNLDSPLPVHGHPTELRRALDNLLSNASRYGRDRQGQLDLTVAGQTVRGQTARGEQEDGKVELMLTDRGPGVDAEDVARLLRPFERGNTARSETSGAGLGLAIVLRIAQAHGGTFVMQPLVSSGLACKFVLPRAKTEAFKNNQDQ